MDPTCIVSVLEARNLFASDSNGKSDPYVKLITAFGTTENFNKLSERTKTPLFKTTVSQATLNPRWEKEHHKVNLKNLAKGADAGEIPLHAVVEVWDEDVMPTGIPNKDLVRDMLDAMDGDDLIGCARIPLEYFSREYEGWFKLFRPHRDSQQGSREAGAILLRFTPEHFDVLDAEHKVLFAPLPAIPSPLPPSLHPLENGQIEWLAQVVRNVYLKGDRKAVYSRGTLLVTSHRLIFTTLFTTNDVFTTPRPVAPILRGRSSMLDIPLGSIKICRFKNSTLSIKTHEHRVFRFEVTGGVLTFESTCCLEASTVSYSMINAVAIMQSHIYWCLQEQLFPFKCEARVRWPATLAKPEESCRLTSTDLYGDLDLLSEFHRQKALDPSAPWRCSVANTSYNLCATYPSALLVPKAVSDEVLQRAAAFRSRGRVPALTFWDKETKGVLCRCSQPMSGILQRQSDDDKMLVDAISASAARPHDLLIIDCRPKLNAAANRMAGKGFEDPDWYSGAQIHFMGIENIHTMRASLKHLADASSGERLSWLRHVSITLDAAVRGSQYIGGGSTVLVHCSDGWDRTAQVASLIQVMRDPYFRTVRGFLALIVKDWCAFGHKFAHRCGGPVEEERAPIFVQFLDCVYQVQNPAAFEFDERLLLFLARHAYSQLFPDFWCNSEAERVEYLAEGFKTISESLWSVVLKRQAEWLNLRFDPSVHELTVEAKMESMQLWEQQYRRPVFEDCSDPDLPSAPSTSDPTHTCKPSVLLGTKDAEQKLLIITGSQDLTSSKSVLDDMEAQSKYVIRTLNETVEGAYAWLFDNETL
eukprot:gene6071-7293_t